MLFKRESNLVLGWDCYNGNCSACAAGRKGDHGIHNDAMLHVLMSELHDGRRVALTFEINTKRYPPTVDTSRHWDLDKPPRPVDLSLHVQTREGGYECSWGMERCQIDFTTALGSDELWNRVPETERDVDKPGETFWKIMEEKLVELIRNPLKYPQPDDPPDVVALRSERDRKVETMLVADREVGQAQAAFEAACKTWIATRK